MTKSIIREKEGKYTKEITSMDYVALGKSIKKFRHIADLTQEDVAEECECSTSHITQIENAKVIPSLDMLIKIANALHVTIDKLVNRDYKHPEYIYLKDISERLEKYSVARRILICEDLNRYLDTIEKFSLLE